jgi:hypothetical protein
VNGQHDAAQYDDLASLRAVSTHCRLRKYKIKLTQHKLLFQSLYFCAAKLLKTIQKMPLKAIVPPRQQISNF